jgi:hypothetical protein
MTLEEEVRRADKAREVINHSLFKEAFETVGQALLHGMRNAPIADGRLRLRLLDRYELLYSLKQVLETHMETGVLAARQLELEEQQKSWMARAKERFV